MSREIELKLDLAPGAHDQVRSWGLLANEQGRTKPQLSIYFDTTDGELAAQGCSLRVRRTSDGWVQTVKRTLVSGGLLERGEWEWEVAGDRPDIARLEELPFDLGMSPAKLSRKLRPVLRSEVERTSWQAEHEGSRVQVDLDVGSLQAGEQEARIEEVEFELLDGAAEAVINLARSVAGDLLARLGVLSKAERGAFVMEDRLGHAAKAAPLALQLDMDVASALSAIVHACLKHFRLNEDVVLAQRDSAALHQARVALRRLRSAFTLFKPVIGGDSRYLALREELRWFTNQLGDARNLDVYLLRDLPDDERISAEEKREQAYDAVIEAMQDRRSRLLVIDLVGWVATGEWRKTRRAGRSVHAFAGKRLDKLWATVDPTGRSLARMDEESRHRLRIEVKKMRYAVEFFDGLYGTSKAKKRFRSAIEELQEALGKLNDLATARTLAADQATEWWQEQSEELEHLQTAETAIRRLGKAGPFWRAEDSPKLKVAKTEPEVAVAG